jgi:hypothetical protein
MGLTLRQQKVISWVARMIAGEDSATMVEGLLGVCVEQDEGMRMLIREMQDIKSERLRSGYDYLDDAEGA